MPNSNPVRWLVLPQNPTAEAQLVESLRISPLLARLLVQRGHANAEAAHAFLNPLLKSISDPLAVAPLRDAAARIWQAIDRGERMVVYGDYDVDGVTSTAMLVRVLRAFGAKVSPFLPNRLDEGYGLSAEGLERCLADAKPQLLIAVDCGTTAAKEIAFLTREGVETIVLDHHQPPAELPKCLLVNPKLLDPPPPALLNLATVGVVFKLCHAFLKLGRDLGKSAVLEYELKQHLDLVAVGTVADVVPLDGENRIMVKAGLAQLEATQNIGLRALKEIAGIPPRLTPYHLGFQLGPRLNAMGRLGDALASLELLLTDDHDRARELATLLDRRNRERQDIEQRTVDEALAMLEGFDEDLRVIVLAKAGWHVGVIGIVAARVAREFHRPAVIIGLDENGAGKGSCRSIEGFDMLAGLRQCANLLDRFGGHQAAAGLSIQAANVDAFRESLNAAAASMITAEALLPSIKIAAEVPLAEIGPDLMDELRKLEPYGEGNRAPIFASRGVRLKSQPRLVGRGHLKLWLTDGRSTFDAIGFGMGERELNGDRLDVAYSLHWNEYRGNRRIQLKLVDVRDA